MPDEMEKEWPEVTVLICTYDRFDLLLSNMQALADNIRYPADKLKWVICDDSSPGGYAGKLKKNKLVKSLKAEVISTEINSGWAANVNNGLVHVDTPYLFFIEDDYLTGAELPIDTGVALMEVKPGVGMVRYRGSAGTHVVLHQFEADISEWLPEHRDGYGLPGKLTYLQFDQGSPTPYVYSHGAHLKHRRFHEYYGLYPTVKMEDGIERGLKLGETEETYAHSVKDGMKANPIDAPAIVIFPDFIPMWFDHVGESYQLTDKDTTH